ncbi:MAG: c-type cytochrome [Chloroflexi bacterium]|nr:c-type cytochrome [Chloroflexota bacterium]
MIRFHYGNRGGFMTRPSLVLAALLLAACSPPKPVATITPAATLVPDIGYPQTPPDVALGAQIFAKRCTACHGEAGLADGPLVRAKAIPAPPQLAAWDTGWDKTPAERFAFIAVGNMDKMMPPWNEALSEPERWAVTLFTYTLHTTPEQLEQGRNLWAAECASCHGADGRGTAEADINLSDPRHMIGVSDETLYNSITHGLADGSHVFAQLDDDQRRSLVAYTRSLSVANPDAIGQPLPAETTAQ